MIIRTFFDKNNTLIKNNTVNTGKNPITELFYGGSLYDLEHSRYILHFDETKLKKYYNDGLFPELDKMTHILKMTNTSCFDLELLNTQTSDGKDRASSFDLILFKIGQDWDEGTGYDYQTCTNLNGDISLSYNPSNWIYSKTLSSWSGGSGVYSGDPSSIIIGTQHFDNGNENLEIDITNYVNDIITGETNYGLGLAYSYELENTPTSTLQYVGFFTRHTQTFYEPYIETKYDMLIKDDRNKFYLNKDNKLYLYVNAGGVPTNLDNNPSVIINDSNNNILSSYTPNDVTHVTKGIYSIDINISNSACTDCITYYDVWSGLTINSIDIEPIELDFIVNTDGYYNIGINEEIPKEYGFSVSGIKQNEKIVRGDIRKVIISARIPYTINQQDILDNLEYRIYTKEGPNELTVIDYQNIEMAFDQNYFLIDTNSLLPSTYWIDIKLTTNRNVRTIKDVIKFNIVSQVELKNNN